MCTCGVDEALDNIGGNVDDLGRGREDAVVERSAKCVIGISLYHQPGL